MHAAFHDWVSHRRVCMQAMTGNDAQSAVASEITAMFEYAVFPWVRSFYVNPDLHDGKSIETLCKEYCKARGFPEEMWASIDIPCNFVIDNDPRHAMMRQYMAVPRDPRLPEQKKQWLSTLQAQQSRDSQRPSPSPPATKRAATLGRTASQARNLSHCDAVLDRVSDSSSPAELVAARNARTARTREQAALDRYAAKEGVDYYEHCIWQAAQADTRYIRVLPQQFADHPPNTPEMNSPAEHMVGTIKGVVKRCIIAARFDLEQLKLGSTYQKWVLDAVQERGNGAAGSWHVGRSVEKLPCIHKILAADAGDEVTVQYIFSRWAPHEHADEVAHDPVNNRDHGRRGHPQFDKDKTQVHTIKGTAGGYIGDTRFT